jgi:hypothetical protein
MGDLNGDGRAELVTTSYYGGTVSVLLNQGNGTFAAPLVYAAGSLPSDVALTDLNGDGKPDVAITNDRSDDVTTFFNTSH